MRKKMREAYAQSLAKDMMMPTKGHVILDIDEPSTLVPALHCLFDKADVWSRLQEDFSHHCVLFHELADTPKYVKTDLIRELVNDATRVIQSEYTAVAAYHACRPVDRRNYTKHGLLRTNRDLLLSLTLEAFGKMPNLEEVFDPICREYLKWYDGTIGLFLSAYAQTSWYKRGCFLSKMADALGQAGQELLQSFSARSIPTMLKCMLPLDWLDHEMRQPSMGIYVSAALQKIILLRASPEDTIHDFGALGLRRDLPADMILGFIDVKQYAHV
jgi:hypothetical protein